MSIVNDQVRRYDTLLDKYQVASLSSRKSSTVAAIEPSTRAEKAANDQIARLRAAIRSLSTTSSSRPLLSRTRLYSLIKEIEASHDAIVTEGLDTGGATDLLWLAVGKATVQVYGVVLSSLLEQTIPLSESLWYWDDVLGSYAGTGLYMLQTSPIRAWRTGREVYADAKRRYLSTSVREAAEISGRDVAQNWRQFYALVQDSVRDRSLVQARTHILSPFALSRTEARQKQERLKRLREQSATAIGLLVDEGLSFPSDYEVQASVVDWKSTIAKSVVILESILYHSQSLPADHTLGDYEEHVIETIDAATDSGDDPTQLAAKLSAILHFHLPLREASALEMTREYGMPSRWVRYWIPGVILLLSGSTLLRIFANRRAEITTWIRELGQTTVDFWQNWVIEPTKRLIGTIRHDETTELAIMSKDSLKSDRESLERMVVAFAIENPEDGRAYSEAEIASIRTKVREGDLTPVLRAYEKEMKSPVIRAVTGNLIQALLIQIQKTKVDVEVAIGGIDSLLKSQELLFGFVGVAPGILLSYFVLQWARGVLGGRRGFRQGQQKGEAIRLLRNIDRTLTNCMPTENGMLSYKDHGLLICEVDVLRQRVMSILPGKVQREFLEDIDDLLDVRQGIDKQAKVVERIHWAYSKWLK